MIPIILLYFLRFCECELHGSLTYVMNMDSQMEACDEESQSFVGTSRMIVGRYNDTVTYMHGDIIFLKDVGPNTMVELTLLKEASGQYELIMTHEICDFCSEVRKGAESDYYGYIKYFDIPNECPFEAGDYPIKEFILDTDDIPMNSHTAGRYQAYLKLYENRNQDCGTSKVFMFCLTIKVVIELA